MHLLPRPQSKRRRKPLHARTHTVHPLTHTKDFTGRGRHRRGGPHSTPSHTQDGIGAGAWQRWAQLRERRAAAAYASVEPAGASPCAGAMAARRCQRRMRVRTRIEAAATAAANRGGVGGGCCSCEGGGGMGEAGQAADRQVGDEDGGGLEPEAPAEDARRQVPVAVVPPPRLRVETG